MALVDSHCHLNYLLEAVQPIEALQPIIERAGVAGVSHMLCIGVDLAEFPRIQEICHAFSQVKSTVGVHPNEVAALSDADWSQLLAFSQEAHVIGIGETGLDYYRTQAQDQPRQQEYFCRHIELAIELQKPLVIHTRQAREDTIAIMRQMRAEEAGGVMHCFSEDWDMAKKALDLGFYIAFSGIITFKNADEIRDVAKKVPLEQILVETDSPYLAPVPHRGKTNEPAYVSLVAQKLAEIKGITLEELTAVTTANVQRLFGWPEDS